jgi:hypothetical protein
VRSTTHLLFNTVKAGIGGSTSVGYQPHRPGFRTFKAFLGRFLISSSSVVFSDGDVLQIGNATASIIRID